MSFEPNWISSPSTTIMSILAERDMTINNFAKLLNWNISQTTKLVKGNLLIDEDIAGILEKTLGSSKSFWITRQNIYTERKVQIQKKEEEWLKNFPVSSMIAKGWISKSLNMVDEILKYFNLKSIREWDEQYARMTTEAAFRKSPSFNSDIISLFTWIRRAEIITQDYKSAKWDKDLFEKTLINDIRPLTRLKKPIDFLPRLASFCAKCGVVIAIVPNIPKCHASGATKFLNKNKALMVLSFRHLSDDHFWFTFFHEAGHLILHEDEGKIRIENIQGLGDIDEETEANIFATECLIPHNMKDEFLRLKRNKRSIISFAMKANISPGIVIGQMQHNNIISYSYLNDYKRRYSWDEIEEGIARISN